MFTRDITKGFQSILFGNITVNKVIDVSRKQLIALCFLVAACVADLFCWHEGLPGAGVVSFLTCVLLAIAAISVLGFGYVKLSALISLVVLLLPLLWSFYLGYQQFRTLAVTSQLAYTQVPIALAPVSPRPLFAHISDTHFIGNLGHETFEGTPWDLVRLQYVAEQLVRLKPRYLLLTGDVTDSGSSAQWKQAEDTLLEPMRRAGIIILMAPGNHDLQSVFFDRHHDEKQPAPHRIALLAQRFIEAQYLEMPTVTSQQHSLKSMLDWQPTPDNVRGNLIEKCERDCSYSYSGLNPAQPNFGARNTGNPKRFVPVPVLPREVVACFDACSNSDFSTEDQLQSRSQLVDAHNAVSACPDWFPLEYHNGPLTALSLCSSAQPEPSIFSNAIGAFGPAQLKRFADQLHALPPGTRYVLILLHHSTVRPADEIFGAPTKLKYENFIDSLAFEYTFLKADLRESRTLVQEALNASRMTDGPEIILFYGHRHRHLGFLGSVDNSLITEEAPAAFEPGEGVWLGYEVEAGERHRIRWQWASLPASGG
jgi:3',5'-cyclic AMP phosphodiesterase CpdA